MNKKDLTQGWLERYSIEIEINSPHDKETWWVYDQFEKIIDREPYFALEVIQDVLSSTDNENILEILAAGPLEELLVKHGELLIAKVTELANANARFKWLLAGVWKNSINDHIWEKMITAAKDAPEKLPRALG